MTLTINVTPAQRARLLSEAAKWNMTLDDYVLERLLGAPMPPERPDVAAWVAALEAWSESHRTDAPAPPPEALERGSLYENRA